MTYEIPQNAKILSIREDSIKDDYSWYDGLIIETNKGEIKLVIENGRCCCENWGALFFETPDDISYFIGAEIIEIKDIDIQRDEDIENETQLRITTDKGIIQYAIYNEHNGYYSHGTIKQVFDCLEHGSL